MANNATSTSQSTKVDILYFAPATKRFLVRFLDAFLLLLFNIIFAFLFYCLCDTKSNVIFNMENTQWYQLDLFLFLTLVINLLYFIGLPLVWKGQTLFSKLFHIKTISTGNKKYFWWHISCRDFFIWIHFSLLFLIFSIVLTFLNKQSIVDQVQWAMLIWNTNETISIDLQIVHWFFKILLVFCLFVSLFIFGNTIYNSRYESALDLRTHTAVVETNPKITNAAKNKKDVVISTPSNLPGKIEGELERID